MFSISYGKSGQQGYHYLPYGYFSLYQERLPRLVPGLFRCVAFSTSSLIPSITFDETFIDNLYKNKKWLLANNRSITCTVSPASSNRPQKKYPAINISGRGLAHPQYHKKYKFCSAKCLSMLQVQQITPTLKPKNASSLLRKCSSISTAEHFGYSTKVHFRFVHVYPCQKQSRMANDEKNVERRVV